MMTPHLRRMALLETLVEALLPPLGLTTLLVITAYLLVDNGAGTPWSLTELGLVAAGLGGVTGHVGGRALHLTGQRQPRRAVAVGLVVGVALGLALVLGLPAVYRWRCEARGVLVGDACRASSQGEIAFVPVHHAGWDGAPIGALAGAFFAMIPLGALAWRDQRLLRSRQGLRAWDAHALGPAPRPPAARVKACRNMTLSGQPCGAWFPVEEKIEACPHCEQAFRPAELVDLEVWGLNTVDAGELNRQARANRRRRVGGSFSYSQSRSPWQRYGVVRGVPEVLTVAQALALVHGHMEPAAPGSGPDGPAGPASDSALQKALLARASRASAWFWLAADHAAPKHDESALARVRPEAVRLASGATRLAALARQRSTLELRLQLDQGLLPLSIHFAYQGPGGGPGSGVQQDLWVPVAPAGDHDGRWVPRLEGEAVRTWLSDLGRGESGAALRPRLKTMGGALAPYIDEPNRPMELLMLPIETLRAVEAGALELRPGLGDWLADWDWLGADKLQQLRQQVLVTCAREDR